MEQLSERTAIYRVAEHLAEGPPGHEHFERAAGFFALIQEPDAAMAAAGDARIWRNMIDAALTARRDAPEALPDIADNYPGGLDEEGDMRFTELAPSAGTASWVQPPKPDGAGS